jgi:hypothetical protein
LVNERTVAVDEPLAYLNAFVDGSGMHQEGTLLSQAETLLVDLVGPNVFAFAREKAAIVPLYLDTEGHYYVRVL